MIFENTHEAIVDPETWQIAQRTRKTVHRTDTLGTANPLTGFLFCADCGEKLYNHWYRRHTKKGTEFFVDFYECSTYKMEVQRETKHTLFKNEIKANIIQSGYTSTAPARSALKWAVRSAAGRSEGGAFPHAGDRR